MRFKAKLETVLEFQQKDGSRDVYIGTVNGQQWRITRGLRYWYGENISTGDTPVFALGTASDLLAQITGSEVDLA